MRRLAVPLAYLFAGIFRSGGIQVYDCHVCAFGCESNGDRSSNSAAGPSYNRGSVSKYQIVTLWALAFFTKERTSYLRNLSGVNAMLGKAFERQNVSGKNLELLHASKAILVPQGPQS